MSRLNVLRWVLNAMLVMLIAGFAWADDAETQTPVPAPAAAPADAPAAESAPKPDAPKADAPATEAAPKPDAPAADAPAAEPGVQIGKKPDPALLAAPSDKIMLNFRDASIDAVLDYLSAVAGLIVVKPTEVSGRITIISKQPMTIDEAVQVFNTVLREKGYAAVRMDRTLKIMSVSSATKSSVPVRVGANPEKIPATDEIITQVVPVSSAESTQLLKDLRPILSETAAVTANAGSNTIIITDTSANIRRLVQVISAMDSALTSVSEVKVFPLQYARATDTARLINDTFGENARSRSSSRNQRDPRAEFFRNMMRGGRGGEDNNDSESPGRVDAPLTASADDRTNTVVVAGPPSTLKVVEDVIKELDANPVATQGVFVYAIEHAQSKNLETVLNTLFGATGSARNSSTSATGTNTNRQRGNNTSRFPETPIGGPNTGGSTPGGPSEARNALLQAANLSPASMEALGELVGNVQIVADPDTNSLLVMTAPGNFERVRTIIKELDRPVPQVLIKVLIAEVTHSDSVDLGAEFSVVNAPNNSTLFTDFGVEAAGMASGGLVYKLVAGDMSATLRALEEVGKLEVLSRPYILASDNQLATITVGSEVPFIRNTRITDNGDTINTIQYDDVGIILNVTPHISPDKLVTMDVAPEISSISGESVPISETVNAPVIEKRSASTRVAIQTGKTIVIGGLMQDQKTATIKKVPLLGDIPLVGLLFQRQENEKRKTELLIFLTPHVASEADRLEKITEDEKKGTQIVPDAVQPGEFDRHLRGLQRGDGVDRPEPHYDPNAPNPTNGPNEIDPKLRLSHPEEKKK